MTYRRQSLPSLQQRLHLYPNLPSRLNKGLFEEIFIRSWWVSLFCLICYVFLDIAGEQQRQNLAELKAQMERLNEEKLAALVQQEDLLRQIYSQSDPAWIELTLMKGLGVVPEGQIKVHFIDP
jgi:hypothetical protein